MDEQLNMFFPMARRHDPTTSHMAAANVVIRQGSHKALLLGAYAGAGGNGLTDEEAGVRTGLFEARAAYWRRCSDLREMNLIEATGETRRSRANEMQMVCRITDAGRSVFNGDKQ
jgi:hypothetical protein